MSTKPKKPKNGELDKLIKKLTSSDISIKKNALTILKKKVRRNIDIAKTISALEKSILLKNEDIWKVSADVLNYYFQNFVSYIWYSFPAERFFNNIRNLYNENKEIRKNAVAYLNRERRRTPGRGWKFLSETETKDFEKKLASKDTNTRRIATKELETKVKNNENIYRFILILRDLLIDEDKKIRGSAGFALTYFYGTFTSVTYGYYMEHVYQLENKDKNVVIDHLSFLESLTSPDMVSDRDEHDIGFAIPVISTLLSEEDKDIKKHSLKTIQASLHQGQDVSDSLPSIITVLTSNEVEFHEKASFILRDIAMDKTDLARYEGQLLDLLASKSDPVKFGTADALTAYYAHNNNVDSVNTLLAHEDKDVRQEAIGTLEQIKSKVYGFNMNPFIERLKELLNDNNKEVRLVSARSLVNVCKTSQKPIVSLTIPILKEALSDPEMKFRLNAANNLKIIAEYEINISSAIPNLTKVLDDEHKDVGKLASDAIMKFIQRNKDAELVMEKINEYNLVKTKPNIKRLVAKCNKILKKGKKKTKKKKKKAKKQKKKGKKRKKK